MLRHVPVEHVPVGYMLGHVLKQVPRHVLKHMPNRHVPKHVPRHVLEHVPQNRLPEP